MTLPQPVRVAYITCDTPAWYGIAETMRQRRGWTPVYWIAEPGMREPLGERFPGVIVHSRYEAYHLVSPPELADLEIPPLDEAFLAEMAEEQVIALKMMDVMDSLDAFDFNARRRFFHQRLRYWRAMLHALRPDVAVFGFSPHVIYDYAIYVLCRHYGVRTMMFEATFNFALLFAFEDHMQGSLEMKERYDQLVGEMLEGDVPLMPLYDGYLTRLQGKYDEAMPWYMRDQFKTMPKDIAATVYQGRESTPAHAAARRRLIQWPPRWPGRQKK